MSKIVKYKSFQFSICGKADKINTLHPRTIPQIKEWLANYYEVKETEVVIKKATNRS